MTQFKIISNPYLKEISYQYFDDSENEWNDLTKDPKYKGRLKATKLINGFFPFIVNEAIDTIIREFMDDKDKIELEFEGTSDEYADLVSVCNQPKIAEHINLEPFGRRLNNAYEILPDIVSIFNGKVRPIVNQSEIGETDDSETVESDLKKFSDASNDIIPISVIGNYSAGKSTFINALIGQEILPSGDKAVTARVFEIFQSSERDVATVTFNEDSKDITLKIKAGAFEVIDGEDNGLVNEIKSAVTETQEGLAAKVNRVLTIINDSGAEHNLKPVIQIHIPFNKGIWEQFDGRFVILDTPGSNAASHADHKEVLTDAMKGMSNGIPVYVAEADTLDSNDNEKLYEVIKQMEGLDPRFTMIIVNKADGANLPKDGFDEKQTEEILNEAIPKNLYSSGIYFVSSIMGLGSKNNGVFIDQHSDETFNDNKKKYSDSSSKYYKELYKYDIMPEQIKSYSMKLAEQEAKQNKVFANSGLYSVEHAIQTFALKYTSYNKCQQSKLFLEKVINLTDAKLSDALEQREKTRKDMQTKLEEDKKNMIADLEKSAEDELTRYKDGYLDNMQEAINKAKFAYSVKELKHLEDDFTKEEQKNRSLSLAENSAKKESNDVSKAVKKGAKKLRNNFGLKAMKEAGASFVKEAKEAIDSQNDLNRTRREIDQAAAEDLISYTNNAFYKQAKKDDEDLARKAQIYWTDCSLEFRNKLSEVVRNTSLTDKKKNEITELIFSYKRLDLKTVKDDDIFKVDEFDYLLNFGKFKAFKMDKLLLNRLSGAYKSRISEVVKKINQNIYSGFLDSFTAWEENLVNIVRSNIVDYSPQLKEQQRKINEESERIHDLQDRKTHLQVYSEDIHSMMDWKES